jgi:hypothetical protein
MPRRSRTTTIGLILTVILAAWPISVTGQEALPTTVVVRAIAQDAKIIGSGVGGARITIRDARSGEVLASGVQEGGTGSSTRRGPHTSRRPSRCPSPRRW